MKRFHVNISVADVGRSIEFYQTLFGQEPTVVKDDYAKWMLEDPRVNFAISKSTRSQGVNHVGLRAEIWVRDPDSLAWETFVTHGEITHYGDGIVAAPAVAAAKSRCCA